MDTSAKPQTHVQPTHLRPGAAARGMNRRGVVAGIGATALLGGVAFGAGGVLAQDGQAPDGTAPALDLQMLADGVALATGAGANVLVVRGDDGLTLVDGGRAEHAGALLAFVSAQFDGAPVVRLFNTHWHPENTGANDVLGPQGAEIVAHKNTQLWMGVEFGDWTGARHEPRAPAARPNRTFYTEESFDAGGVRLDAAYMLQAHTDGDIYVRLPEHNIIAAGGVAAPPPDYPAMDHATGGWIGGMLDGLLDLIGISDEETRIVPSEGPVLSRADLQDQYDMLFAVKERVLEMMIDGKGPEDMLAEGATADFDPRWGDPERFVHSAYAGMLGHLRVLGVIIA